MEGNAAEGVRERTLPKATEKQVRFIDRLMRERVVTDEQKRWYYTEGARDRMNIRTASRVIEALLKADLNEKGIAVEAARTAPLPDVPAGRYAIRTADGVKFYRIDRPEKGKWSGWTFVKVQASDVFYPVRARDERHAILTEIAKDPKGAAELYGRELGVCGICGRILTDEESRARGIGPVCAEERGW